MRIIDLGLIDFAAANEIQLETLEKVRQGGQETLYLLEHNPVITFGRHGGRENVHLSEAELARQNIQTATAKRGGNVTCHFPGQAVAYPVFRLEKRPGGVKQFFFDLEEVIILTAKVFGVEAFRVEGRPGVWTEAGKLASIGIGVSHWVSYNGLALNVLSDVSLFSAITLCGLADARAVSLEGELARLERPRKLEMKDVKDELAESFRRVFRPQAA